MDHESTREGQRRKRTHEDQHEGRLTVHGLGEVDAHQEERLQHKPANAEGRTPSPDYHKAPHEPSNTTRITP